MPELVDKNKEHLKLLSIFHYVIAGVTALFSCFPLIHVFMGVMMLSNPQFFETTKTSTTPPGMESMIGWMFIGMGSFIIILGWTFAILIAIAGRNLQQRKHFLYCLIIAAIECLFMPLGTILGIFTLMVLLREGVKPMFDTKPDLITLG